MCVYVATLFKSLRCHFYFYFLRFASTIRIKPIAATAMAGAGLSLTSPDKNIHIATAMQMIPIINLALPTW